MSVRPHVLLPCRFSCGSVVSMCVVHTNCLLKPLKEGVYVFVVPCAARWDSSSSAHGTSQLKHWGTHFGCCTTLRRSEVIVPSVHSVILIGYSQFGGRGGFIPNSHDCLTPRFPILQCHKSVDESFQRVYLGINNWSYLSRLDQAGTRVRVRRLADRNTRTYLITALYTEGMCPGSLTKRDVGTL